MINVVKKIWHSLTGRQASVETNSEDIQKRLVSRITLMDSEEANLRVELNMMDRLLVKWTPEDIDRDYAIRRRLREIEDERNERAMADQAKMISETVIKVLDDRYCQYPPIQEEFSQDSDVESFLNQMTDAIVFPHSVGNIEALLKLQSLSFNSMRLLYQLSKDNKALSEKIAELQGEKIEQ